VDNEGKDGLLHGLTVPPSPLTSQVLQLQSKFFGWKLQQRRPRFADSQLWL